MAFTVSVVIPAYNAEKHIGRAIDSVLNQRRPADEIIVVDDGSSDGTADVVKGYGDKVRYIHQENGGASAARNTAIEAANFEWVAFLDCDDEWLEEYLAEQIKLVERNPDIVWACTNFYICYCSQGHKQEISDHGTGNEQPARKEVHDDYFKAFIKGAAGWTGSLMIRRETLYEAGLFMPRLPMGNDIDMWWRIAYRHKRIGYNPKPLAVYHCQVNHSITHKQRDPELLYDLIERHLELSENEGAFDRFKPCAVHMIRFWTHNYLIDERISKIRNINRFSKILPIHNRMIIRLLSLFPRITMCLIPVLRKINKVLKINI